MKKPSILSKESRILPPRSWIHPKPRRLPKHYDAIDMSDPEATLALEYPALFLKYKVFGKYAYSPQSTAARRSETTSSV
jgi:hypothetical protein